MISIDDGENSMLKSTIYTKDMCLFSLKRPKLEFAKGETGTRPIKSLPIKGPFDFEHSDSILRRKFDRIKVCVTYPKDNPKIRELLDTTVSFLVEGYSRRDWRDIDFPGFLHAFKAKLIPPEEDEYVSFTLENLRDTMETLSSAFEGLPANCRKVVLIGGRSHKALSEHKEEYVRTKRTLMLHDIPSQYLSNAPVTTHTIYGILSQIELERSVGYGVWNVALGIYGKVGGLAWALSQVEPLDQTTEVQNGIGIDITVGLGFSKTKEDDVNKYFVGCATVLDRNGRLVSVTAPMTFKTSIKVRGLKVPAEIMEVLVQKAIEASYGDPKTQKILAERDTLYLVVHRRAHFHHDEITGIERAITNLQVRARTIKVAFVSIIKDQDLFAFPLKGSKAEEDTVCGVVLGPHTAILNTVHLKHGISPIKITLENMGREDCPFENIRQVSYHTNALTLLHWQTTIPRRVKMPASLHFASNVARLEGLGIRPNRESPLWYTPWFL